MLIFMVAMELSDYRFMLILTVRSCIRIRRSVSRHLPEHGIVQAANVFSQEAGTKRSDEFGRRVRAKLCPLWNSRDYDID